MSKLAGESEGGVHEVRHYSLRTAPHLIMLRYISMFAQWSEGLATMHKNCKQIPVQLVLKMSIKMVGHLKKCGVKINTETLATTFWLALKFFSSRDTIPNASFMGMITKTPKHTLISNEPIILTKLGWDLYAFYKE